MKEIELMKYFAQWLIDNTDDEDFRCNSFADVREAFESDMEEVIDSNEEYEDCEDDCPMAEYCIAIEWKYHSGKSFSDDCTDEKIKELYVLLMGETFGQFKEWLDEADIKSNKKEETGMTEEQYCLLGDALEAIKALRKNLPSYPSTLAESVEKAYLDIDDAMCGPDWEATR